MTHDIPSPADDRDEGCNPSGNPSLGDMIALRFGRRDLLKGVLAASAIGATLGEASFAAAAPASAFTFEEIEATVSASHAAPAGYDVQVLLRWGDPLFPDVPAFDHSP